MAKLYAKKIPDTDVVENFGGVSKRLSNIYAVNGIFTKVSTDSIISDYDLSQYNISSDTTSLIKEVQLNNSGFLILRVSTKTYDYPCVGIYCIHQHGLVGNWAIIELGKRLLNAYYADIETLSINSTGLLKITAKTTGNVGLLMSFSFKRNLCL